MINSGWVSDSQGKQWRKKSLPVSGREKRKVTILKHIEPSVVLNKAYSQEKLLYQSLNCSGEGNGSPLQYSCLENPMDGRAW